jgi:hypothetical protein
MSISNWGNTPKEIEKNLHKANLEFLRLGAATQKDHKNIVKEVKEIKAGEKK